MKTSITITSPDNGHSYTVSCGGISVENRKPGIDGLIGDLGDCLDQWRDAGFPELEDKPADAILDISLRFSVNPDQIVALMECDRLGLSKKIVSPELSNPPKEHREKMAWRCVFDLIAYMLIRVVDPASVENRYIREGNQTSHNPDFVFPPEYRLFPESLWRSVDTV